MKNIHNIHIEYIGILSLVGVKRSSCDNGRHYEYYNTVRAITMVKSMVTF